jgi:uncharacterized protein YecT (DUF1311 family)
MEQPMKQKTLFLALAISLAPLPASTGPDIEAACYKDCEKATTSNPDYKACLARAADKADAAFNEAYKDLLAAVRAAGKDMGQAPDTLLGDLKDAQKQWIAYRDPIAPSRIALLSAEPPSEAIIPPACALSYQRINDFDRIKKDVLGGE